MDGSVWRRWAGQSLLALVVLACGGLAFTLAALHPVAPVAAVLLVALVVAASARYPDHWPFWLPALLPVLSLAPWTGWWLVDEWDVCVLAVLAGAYGRWLCSPSVPRVSDPRWGPRWLWLALASGALLSLGRGWVLAESPVLGLGEGASSWLQGFSRAVYGDYDQIWNTLRVSKSLCWVLLLAPVLSWRAERRRVQPVTLFLRGALVGLAVVCGLVLWERLLYVGLLDFKLPYRTTAWFWEMHVGGGAIDAYLALTAPLAVWALWRAPDAKRWWAAAALLLLAVYAVLTTYSRGVCGAFGLALLCMAVLAWRWRLLPEFGMKAHAKAWSVLAAAVLAQTVLVLASGNFMAGRLADSDADLLGRWRHWQAGVGLLQTPSDWVWGLGAGRLPAQYSQRVEGGEFPGRTRWQPRASEPAFARLSGPVSRADLASAYGLTQRVDLAAGGGYTVRWLAQAERPTRVLLRVCERHLLYDMRCQRRLVLVDTGVEADPDWQSHVLQGPELGASADWSRWREGVFAVTVLGAGNQIRLQGVELWDPQGRQVLQNTHFVSGTQGWLSVAQKHFRPWHIDNLYLEVLIERGVVGVGLLAALILWAVSRLWQARHRRSVQVWALSACLLSCLALGMLISLVELPRVAFLLWTLLWMCAQPPDSVSSR